MFGEGPHNPQASAAVVLDQYAPSPDDRHIPMRHRCKPNSLESLPQWW